MTYAEHYQAKAEKCEREAKTAHTGDRRYWPAVVRYFDHVGGLVALEKASFPFLINSREEHSGRDWRA